MGKEVQSMPTIFLVFKGHKTSASSSSVGSVSSHKQIAKVVSPGDVIVAVPPEHYMEESHREPGRYTPRFYFTEQAGAQSVLGSNFIMGHEVLFDVGGGRVGFSESHCDYDRYVFEREERAANVAVEDKEDEASGGLRSKEEEVAEESVYLDVEIAAEGQLASN